VQSSLEFVYEVRIIYCVDEISFILHMPSKTIGLDINFKLSNSWFWGGREGQDDDGLKSRPKHVVVLTHFTILQYNKFCSVQTNRYSILHYFRTQRGCST
jgi:hypothetical protein